MKNLTHYATIGALLLSSTLSFAQSNGSKGGGFGIPESDVILLKDLSTSTCEIKVTSTFLNEYGIQDEVNSVLNNLKKANPYMAYRIRAEMDQLTWCLTTSRLTKLQSKDSNSLLNSYDPDFQIGIRDIDLKKVYVDTRYFAKMKPNRIVTNNQVKYNQAMFVIHETLHSFLPKDQAGRNDALRTLTRSIYLNLDNASHESFADRVKDLDAAIHTTGTADEFESSALGLAFDRFYRTGSNESANAILNNANHIVLVFKTMTQELGHYNLFTAPGFGLGSSIIPRNYQLGALLAFYRNQYTPRETVLYEHAQTTNFVPNSQYTSTESSDVRSEFPSRQRFQLGACTVTPIAHYSNSDHGSNNGYGGIGFTGYGRERFDLAYVFNFPKGEFTARLHTQKVIWRLASAELKTFEDATAPRNYQVALKQALNRIRNGECNVTHAPGTPYYQ